MEKCTGIRKVLPWEMPNGTRSFPARSCSYLSRTHPGFPDGEYWIDPNGGSNKDAVKVFCRLNSGETCFSPSISSYQQQNNRNFAKKKYSNQEIWFSQLYNEKPFTYNMEMNQINFLQLLSSKANQQLTLLCNDIQFNDNNLPRLFTNNDKELSKNGSILRYNLLENSCQSTKSTFGKITIEVDTRPQRLPLRDIILPNIINSKQILGLELGRVCFQ
uniref:Fibrillar collagen NC1 domain-containing protein n=1 Tax=Schistosoma japonicum TaxID=6182 RepID=Q5D8P6_SCHJA|nr:unknown [Schistosoma japonicum]